MDQDFLNENKSFIPKEPGTDFQISEPQKGNKKKAIIAIVVAVLIILLGFTIALATKLWNPLWNPFAPNPELVLKQAMENMFDVESMHSKIELDLGFDEPLDEEFGIVSMEYILESDFNNSDKENTKSQTDIDMNISSPEVELLFGLKVKTVDEILYFNIDTLPFIFNAYTAIIGIDLSSFQNKWYRFDAKELGMTIKALDFSSEKTLALEQDLKNLYFQKAFLKVLKRLPEETINKKVSYHYLLTLDKESLKQFMLSLPKTLEKHFPEGILEAKEEEQQAMLESIDKMFEKGVPEFEIWIGKKDKLIYRINWQDSYEFEQSEKMAVKYSKNRVDVNLGIDFSKFNEPVNIIAPEESESIIQVLQGLMSSFYSPYNYSGYDYPEGEFDVPDSYFPAY
jgi:hypothetical protein